MQKGQPKVEFGGETSLMAYAPQGAKGLILFVADMKITYNSFKSSMVGTTDSKTIFTVDPDTPEAHCLRQFLGTQDSSAMVVDCSLMGTCDDTDPELSRIKEVMTVEQLKEKQAKMVQDMNPVAHYGLLYAMVTSFNVDAETAHVVRKICGGCRKRISLVSSVTCTNPDCNTGHSTNTTGPSSNAMTEYNIQVALSDHTGTVNFCHLQSTLADTITGCKAQAFLGMPEEQRTTVKWQYLMEHCKVFFKLKMFKPATGHLPAVQILSMEKQYYPQMAVAQKSGQMDDRF
ncbi:meiosis-specific with OB domain-containing protein-like isoform X2 [Babylonia areolata]|uniref:meiosis-specific with OB domain-containing protein-like isoform X2 n=1 Tax=Babylonia areolata TaxID=304850 RepID=UPI003FD60824